MSTQPVLCRDLKRHKTINAEDAVVAEAMANLDTEYAELCGSLVTV